MAKSAPYVPPPIERMAYLSVECLYNHLRFYTFPAVSDKQKQAVFLECVHVPLKRPDVFNAIVSSAKGDDFHAFTQIISENKVDLTKTADTSFVPILAQAEKSWPIILDAYFSETNPGLALELLTNLIFFPIVDKEMKSLKIFIEKYQKMSTAERVAFLSKQIYTVTI